MTTTPQESSDSGNKSKLFDWIAGFEVIFNSISEEMDGFSWKIVGFVNQPKGNKQKANNDLFEYEFIDQHGCGYGCDDCYYGNIYYPLPDGRYLKIEYYS